LNPGTAYLVGLLHDIGLLVLGHLFPEEYQRLNQLLEDDADLKILDAEETIFGVTHTEIGKIVMRLWNMPDELIAVTTYHHNSHFQGEHEDYVQLLVIVESLLSQHGLARDDYEQEMPVDFLEKLHLDEEDVILAADEVLQESQIIQELARQMCA
jgi:HD-like signal output (HDOD) protein